MRLNHYSFPWTKVPRCQGAKVRTDAISLTLPQKEVTAAAIELARAGRKGTR